MGSAALILKVFDLINVGLEAQDIINKVKVMEAQGATVDQITKHLTELLDTAIADLRKKLA
jgi:hypothetical protein